MLYRIGKSIFKRNVNQITEPNYLVSIIPALLSLSFARPNYTLS